MDKPDMNYIVTYDSNADLPVGFDQENGTDCIMMTYLYNNAEYFDSRDREKIKEFYKLLRNGESITTVQINMTRYMEFFEKHLAAGKDVLYICFSSGLSGSYNAALIAADELKEKYPNNRVVVVDSLSASMGEGLFVKWAVMKRDEGLSLDELAAWLEENKLGFAHLFIVDDLNFLHRGGRVSKTAAVLGTLIGIKPLLHVDNDGHLIPLEKIRGRTGVINRMFAMMDQLRLPGDQPVFISHGDCEEDAERLAAMIRERYGITSVTVDYIGTVIGSHSGPGTIALFFRGLNRG